MTVGAPLETELSRIRRRVSRLPAQRRALQIATSNFSDSSGEFDIQRWVAAFESSDPHEINSVLEVTAGYERIVNHLLEMLHSGGNLVGLSVSRNESRPAAPVLIQAAREGGCYSSAQAAALARLCQMRNRLQHASPDVDASEVHEHVTLLLKVMPRLVTSMVSWLAEDGFTVVPQAKRARRNTS